MGYSRNARRRGLLAIAFASAGLVLGAASLGVPVLAAPAIKLAPHRAIYDLSLESKTASSAITSLRGRMVHEFAGTPCEGYTVNMRWVAVMGASEGDDSLDDVRFASWEDGDGETYTYTSFRYLNEKLVEEVKAHAERGHGTSDGSVSLTKPTKENIALPPNTVFPTEHLRKVIAAAIAGESLAREDVYDVSDDGRQIYSTLAVVNARSAGGQGIDGVANAAPLKQLPAWRVTISYFKGDGSGEQTPAFEQTFDLFANGVASNLLLDYGDIVVKGTLKDIEFLTAGECPN